MSHFTISRSFCCFFKRAVAIFQDLRINVILLSLDQMKHFVQQKIGGILLFILTNNLKNSDFKLIKSRLSH